MPERVTSVYNGGHKRVIIFFAVDRTLLCLYKKMQLSPFQKEHKENLKRLTKKQLINQILIGIEISIQGDLKKDRRIIDLKKQLDQTEQHLRSAENALDYKDKVIDKYKTLLSISIEDL